MCFRPPSLLDGKVWVPVKYFCACPIHYKVHWRVGRILRSCILISVQPLIGPTILYSQSALLCGYWRFCVVYIDTVYIKPITARYGGLLSELTGITFCQEYRRAVFLVPILENKLNCYADDCTLIAVAPSLGVIATAAESLICDLGGVNELSDLRTIKLNARKTTTMIDSGRAQCIPSHPIHYWRNCAETV